MLSKRFLAYLKSFCYTIIYGVINMRNKQHLIAVDLDGTLLTNKKKI